MRPLLSLMVDGMTSPEETRILELHLAECPDCRSSYDWMLATRHVLAGRPAAVPPGDMSLRIRAALASERHAEAQRAVRFRTVYRPAFAMAAAAVVAALCFSVFHRTANPLTPHHTIVAIRPDDGEPPSGIEMPPAPAGRPAEHANEAGRAVKTPLHAKARPIRQPAPENVARVTPSEKPLRIVVPPPATHPGPTVARAPSAAPRKPVVVPHGDLTAKLPVRHTPAAPVAPVNPHSNEIVATNKAPDTNPVTPAPPPLVTAPETHAAPETHTIVVASAGGGSSLLASVREYVIGERARKISTQSFRITSASDAHVRDAHLADNTALEAANRPESASGTFPFVDADYK